MNRFHSPRLSLTPRPGLPPFSGPDVSDSCCCNICINRKCSFGSLHSVCQRILWVALPCARTQTSCSTYMTWCVHRGANISGERGRTPVCTVCSADIVTAHGIVCDHQPSGATYGLVTCTSSKGGFLFYFIIIIIIFWSCVLK